MNSNIFGQNLKLVRKSHGLSQEDFGKVVGVARTTIGSWECGDREPSFNYIMLICEKFDVSPNELFGFEENY